jgi:hypothetical protein
VDHFEERNLNGSSKSEVSKNGSEVGVDSFPGKNSFGKLIAEAINAAMTCNYFRE